MVCRALQLAALFNLRRFLLNYATLFLFTIQESPPVYILIIIFATVFRRFIVVLGHHVAKLLIFVGCQRFFSGGCSLFFLVH